MKKPFIIVLALVAILAACFYTLSKRNTPEFANHSASAELTLYCAAGLRNPVSQIIDAYTEETDRKVNIIYNGSGALLSQIKLGGGDLYLPANIDYVHDAAQAGLTAEYIPAAHLTAVIVVNKDNTSIQSIEDLTKPGVRISFANKSAAIGQFTRKVLIENGVYASIEKNIIVTKPTVNNIIEDVAFGSADATIAWDAVARSHSNLRIIKVPMFTEKRRDTAIAVLNTSTDTVAALHLARYLTAKDRGQLAFKNYGFEVPALADTWSDIPELLVFSGSMLKPAIGERIHAFEQREGCIITTVYEGCGTLVSQMQAGAKPGFYFSCDQTFLDRVQDRFQPGTVISTNEIILLVPKENTKSIHSLDDLLKEGVKIGIAHPVKSALGKLTHTMLEQSSHLQPLQDSGNIVLLASKGDELVTQMQANALDAALLYRSNALASPSITQYCNIVELNRPDAIATQPFATAIDTPYPRQLQRLGDFLTNAEGKKNFLKHGFNWEKDSVQSTPESLDRLAKP